MTIVKNTEQYGLKELGWDRVPTDIIDKRVTDLMDLTGRVAVVTGAGGPCLGQALCNRLAGLGADIVLVGRHIENITEVGKQVSERWGVNTYPICCDLLDYDAVAEMFKEAYDKTGRIDILVNSANFNAGAPFDKMTEEQIRISVDGPYTSVINTCRHVCDYMIPAGGGKIINISSEASQRSKNVNLSVYGASKSGVNGLTRSLAGELAPYGIIVNGVAAGVMFKKSLRAMFENPTDENLGIRASMVGTIQDTIIGRVSIPEEVANTVAFLATDAASYIAGQTIFNGGGSVV